MVFGKVSKVVWPRYASKVECVVRFMLLLEAEQGLEDLEEIEETEVIGRFGGGLSLKGVNSCMAPR